MEGYVTSAHLSVSELSHVAAREAEKYIPPAGKPCSPLKFEGSITKRKSGRKDSRKNLPFLPRTSLGHGEDSVYGACLYQWASFRSTIGHSAGEMVINGSVLMTPLHQDQCHLQQVDSIRFGPGKFALGSSD